MLNFINDDGILDERIDIVVSKLSELWIIYDNLKVKSIEIINKIKECYDYNDRNIFFNNLEVLLYVMDFYRNQIIFFEKKYTEYYLIISSDIALRTIFLNIWAKEIDSFLKKQTDFKIISNNHLGIFDNSGNSKNTFKVFFKNKLQ